MKSNNIISHLFMDALHSVMGYDFLGDIYSREHMLSKYIPSTSAILYLRYYILSQKSYYSGK